MTKLSTVLVTVLAVLSTHKCYGQVGWCNVLEEAPCSEFFSQSGEDQCFGEDCIYQTENNPFTGEPFVVTSECPSGFKDTRVKNSNISVVREALTGESGNQMYGTGDPPTHLSCTESRPCDKDCWVIDAYAICRSDPTGTYTGNNDTWQMVPIGNPCIGN